MLDWGAPKSTSNMYILKTNFTNFFPKEAAFDPNNTQYRITYYEYIELVNDLHSRGVRNLKYAKLARLSQILSTVALFGMTIAMIIDNVDLVLKSSSYFFQTVIVYTMLMVLGLWLQIWQERLAVRKMRAYLDIMNPMVFHYRKLHWEINDSGQYLILHLQYQSPRVADQNKLIAAEFSKMDSFFSNKIVTVSTSSLDASPLKEKMCPFKYAL